MLGDFQPIHCPGGLGSKVAGGGRGTGIEPSPRKPAYLEVDHSPACARAFEDARLKPLQSHPPGVRFRRWLAFPPSSGRGAVKTFSGHTGRVGGISLPQRPISKPGDRYKSPPLAAFLRLLRVKSPTRTSRQPHRRRTNAAQTGHIRSGGASHPHCEIPTRLSLRDLC